MEKTTTSKREWIYWILLAIPFIYSALIWNRLPEQVPTHFNFRGEADDYSSKLFGAIGLPCFAVVLYFILRYIPLIDPRKKNYEYFSTSYNGIRMVLAVFFVVFYFIIIQAAIENAAFIQRRLLFTSLFFLFALLGNYFRNIRPNFFVGIRTPWTLENPEVWKKTHELGGKLWFYGGLSGGLLSLLLPESAAMYLFVSVMVVITLIPVVYSYLLFQKIRKQESDT